MFAVPPSSLLRPRCCSHSLQALARSRLPTSSYRRTFQTRPSTAPKPTIDIRHIRQNPGLYEQNCIDRNYRSQSKNPWRIIELFDQWTACQKQARTLRERNNELRRQLAGAASRSGDAEGNLSPNNGKDGLLEEAKTLKAQLSVIDAKEKGLQEEMEDLALELPNLSSQYTPVGDEPEVIGYINDHPEPEPEPSSSDRVWRSHVHIGSELGLLDFEGAAKASGWGWYYLTNEAALLEQALVQYALSVGMRRGWKVVSPPSIVYSHIAAACGFQPRDQNDERQIYALEQPQKDKTKPSLVLAGTAEIPLAGMKANQIIEDVELPLKTIGVSRCYRAEAGARGVDTKGLYRVHEFTKVEMFGWTLPTDSTEAGFGADQISHSEPIFDEMLAIQQEILQALGLHCRILEMPTNDLGASATRKRDIEAFFPSRRDKDNGWGEVTSASICTDYQSRRLGTRVRLEKAGRKLDFPHTVNGTALAVPRVLAAILENHWNEQDMSVKIPDVLRPWMGGMDRIQRTR
ncbi:seryl-tRNA synthetase [Coniosporium apollinis CBS 100218]|uniref:serine--tRNA ligase n=1 Tax=Coniosporium apollinis (strain CBS 100218) TaxID=1168221 RepID=R7Z0E0_CONA1|nr:seryl-tRNA synthetase [Coniosporium apollinis CBS 100218]EON67514.1 seryl-tRNA synthetase [Coniosporium apollinis CBS 100218]